MANHRQIPALVAELVPFSGSNINAQIVDGEYIVWSYRTPILRIDTKSGVGVFDNQQYSVTTSKQQTLIKRGLALRGISDPLKQRSFHLI